MKLNSLDLFSGVGGFAYALKDICKTVMYCEVNKDAQKTAASAD